MKWTWVTALRVKYNFFLKGTRFLSVTRVYAPRFFVSSQQKFGVMDIKAPWQVTALRTDRVIALRSRTDHVIALK